MANRGPDRRTRLVRFDLLVKRDIQPPPRPQALDPAPALDAPGLTEGERLACFALKFMGAVCVLLGVKALLDFASAVDRWLWLRLCVAITGFCLFDGLRKVVRFCAARRACRRVPGSSARIGFRAFGASEEPPASAPPRERGSRASRGRIGFVTEE